MLPVSSGGLREAIREPLEDTSDGVIIQHVGGGVGHDLEEDGESRFPCEVAPLVTAFARDDELDRLVWSEAEDDGIILHQRVPSQAPAAERLDLHVSPLVDDDHAPVGTREEYEIAHLEDNGDQERETHDEAGDQPEVVDLREEEAGEPRDQADQGHERGRTRHRMGEAMAEVEGLLEVASKGIGLHGEHDV